MAPFLRATDVIDHDHPAVHERALALTAGGPPETACRSFEWVREEIRHSADFRVQTVTCTASEALAAKAGLCLSKSHLLVALLRANGLPAGLVYQRLKYRGRFVLHGLVAVHLPEFGWYRCDPRGNKPGVDAQFVPPVERLAFTAGPDIIDVPGIFPDPLPEVVRALRSSRTLQESLDALPDLPDRINANYPG
jgi:transglutaminase-like putative cysteine protease